MDMPGRPLKSLTQRELLEEIAADLRYLRRVLSEFEPILGALRGNGTGDAVKLAGLRRAARKAGHP